VDAYYARLVALHYSSTGEKDEAVRFMDSAQPAYADDATTIDYFDTIRNSLFKSPAERMAFLEGQLEKEPDNLEIITELFDIYRNVEETEKMEVIGVRLLEMDPSSRAFRLLAEVKYNQGDYADALDLNNQAMELAESDEERRDIHYNLGLTYYEMGRLPQARASAERAIRLDASFGMADLLLGDIYVKAVQNSSFERTDKAVYWLAVDHYRRAIQRDQGIQAQANQKIGQYRRFFPDQEEKFFEGWTNGQEYEINYGRYEWIARTTTVK
jgi:tetratricopeptide (TPR) repeat protein